MNINKFTQKITFHIDPEEILYPWPKDVVGNPIIKLMRVV